jgi:hypothetical protein
MARNHKAGGQGEPHAARMKSATCITIAVLQALCQPLPLVLINFGDHRRFPNLTASVRPPYVRSAPSRRPAPCADRSTGRGADRLAADLAPSTRPELGPVVAPTRSSIASGRTAFQIASSHRRLYAFSADHDRAAAIVRVAVSSRTRAAQRTKRNRPPAVMAIDQLCSQLAHANLIARPGGKAICVLMGPHRRAVALPDACSRSWTVEVPADV